MKVLFVAILILASSAASFAQGSSKGWTAWAPVEGGWAQFAVIVEFNGGPKSVEQLNKANPKSLKVNNLIGGAIVGALPPEAAGVKNVRVVFSNYGKFRDRDDFAVDFVEFYYRKDGTNLNPTGITRPATAFDVEEAKKPPVEANLITQYPATFGRFLGPLNINPSTSSKLKGRVYRVESEWRRKGDTLELRVKDYRPS